jgi:hypothetical protein
MGIRGRIAGGLAAMAMLAAGMPARAADNSIASAEKLRKLDIMLMVTALRCRNTPYGFQSDYNRFAENHLDELNEAGRTLEAGFVRQQGETGAKRALDRMSVVMANTYGLGHPTLGCQQLQAETRDLARESRPGALLAAADRLLTVRGGVTLAAR